MNPAEIVPGEMQRQRRFEEDLRPPGEPLGRGVLAGHVRRAFRLFSLAQKAQNWIPCSQHRRSSRRRRNASMETTSRSRPSGP